MFVHFVVCLVANSDGWIYCLEMSSKNHLQIVCWLLRETSWQVLFCKPYIINRDSSSRNKSKTGHWDVAEYIFIRTLSKHNSWIDIRVSQNVFSSKKKILYECFPIGPPPQPIQFHNLNPYPKTLELKVTLKTLGLKKNPNQPPDPSLKP